MKIKYNILGEVDCNISGIFEENEANQAAEGAERPKDKPTTSNITDDELDNLVDEDVDLDEIEEGTFDDDFETMTSGGSGGEGDEEEQQTQQGLGSDDDDDDDTKDDGDIDPDMLGPDDDSAFDDDDEDKNNKQTKSTNKQEETKDEQDDSTDGKTDGTAPDTDDENSKDSADSNNESNDENSDKSNEDTTSNDEPEEDLDELDGKELKKLLDQIQEQEDFVDGEVQKNEISEEKSRQIEALDDAGVTLETVGRGYNGDTRTYSKSDVGGINCVVIKKLTQSLIDTNPFGCFTTCGGRGYKEQGYIDNIENGIRLGNMLGRKLQIRNEERNTDFSRLRSGKIDKRLINSLGYGAEQVFYQTQVDMFSPVVVRISIDASGSMGGVKWDKTMVSVVAICKAASMVKNLDVIVDFRTTTDSVGGDKPLVIVAYDSRKDKFEKVRRLFPYIDCNGTTPEGLCFEAIAKDMAEVKQSQQFFINFSDGEPCFGTKGFHYGGSAAANHTKKQVDIMRAKNIKILSYYISSYDEGSVSGNFSRMYGKDAKNVSVTDLISLTKSLNGLFLEK